MTTSRKRLMSQTSIGYKNEHHLLKEKVAPESLVVLRLELQLPHHRDIFLAAQKQPTFEAAIGCIAAMLDIALDGEYEPDDLFTMLVHALRNRDNLAALRAAGLVSAELVEKDTEVTLEFGGTTLAPQAAKDQIIVASKGKQPGLAIVHAHFMQEVGCDVCENRSACQQAERCLGEDAYTSEFEREEE